MEFHGAKLALFIGNRLPLIRRDDRPDIPFPDHWDFPGGGREGRETPWQTAARETFEELSLDLSGVDPSWHMESEAAHLPGARVHFFVAHLPEAARAQIRLGDEGQEWRLFSAREVLELPKTVPSQIARLRLYLARGAGSAYL